VEDHSINEEIQRETKELFLGSPIWAKDGPETLGSIITMKRQLYSNHTSYGRGKLIMLSLYPSIDTSTKLTLELHKDFLIKDIEKFKEFAAIAEEKVIVRISLAKTETGEVSFRPAKQEEEDFIVLLACAIESWMLINNISSVKELCEEAELDAFFEEIKAFMDNPTDPETWISFDLGYDLESFMTTK